MTREEWVPVRHVAKPQTCRFCRGHISAGKPGTTTGSRGTKAWWSKTTNTWECLTCRSEGFRVEGVREADMEG